MLKMLLNRAIRIFKVFSLIFMTLVFLFHILHYSISLKYLRRETIRERKFEGKDSVTLCVGILSKLSAFSRRQSIRLTWMRLCSNRRDVICQFFTDKYDNKTDLKTFKKVIKEDEKYGDLLHMPFKGGHNFAMRLIWMIQWYTTRYEFDYFLRIDDDYFLCIDHLLSDLSYRPKRGLYWGYLHCREHVVRIDEGFMILSYDIIHEALQKLNSSLKCHPFGDQAVALWIQESALNITYFADNDRVVHAATSYNQSTYLRTDVCDNYIGLHGTYPNLMYKYWIFSHELHSKPKQYNIPNILPYNKYCEYDKTFDYRWFWPHVRFEPKLCRDNPTWSITNQKFQGREDKGEEAIY